ncbi:VacJ family lipoprotein [Pseudohongiella acticola]|uniref:MlaA family lipoprotein n=1 Tax=Pseudohongiella acticola TaxID=1524254 RepID=UPI0030EBAA60
MGTDLVKFRSMALTLALVLALPGSLVLAQPAPPVDDNVEPNVVPNIERATDANGDAQSFGPNMVEVAGYRDPLIRLNRAVFAFNDVSYRYVLIPAARTYLNVTPDPVKKGIGNFFYNLRTPIYALNHLFQGKPDQTARDLGRFLVNTTVGIAGIFDPAESWLDMERQVTSAGDTMARYGVGYGAYLVLPFIGSSNLRNAGGMLLEMPLNSLEYLLDDPESTVVRVFDNFQLYAPVIQSYTDITAESEDPYIFMRNLHIQGIQRDAAYAAQERAEAE